MYNIYIKMIDENLISFISALILAHVLYFFLCKLDRKTRWKNILSKTPVTCYLQNGQVKFFTANIKGRELFYKIDKKVKNLETKKYSLRKIQEAKQGEYVCVRTDVDVKAGNKFINLNKVQQEVKKIQIKNLLKR